MQESHGEKAQGGIKRPNSYHRPDQPSRPIRILTKLQRQPENAGTRHEPQKSKCSQVAVDADAPGKWLTQRVRGELPYRVLPCRRCPSLVLHERPNDHHSEQNRGQTNASKRNRMRLGPKEKRDLVAGRQPRKQHSIDAPREKPVAAEPERYPRQSTNKQRKKYSLCRYCDWQAPGSNL